MNNPEPMVDKEAAAIAYNGYDGYWAEDSSGSLEEAWAASARAVMQAKLEKAQASAPRLRAVWMGCVFDGYGWWLPKWCVKTGETAPSFKDFKMKIDAEKFAIDVAMKEQT